MKNEARPLLAHLSNLKPDFLIYMDQTRVGFKGGQINWFIEELKDLGIILINATSGKAISHDTPAAFRETVDKQVSSDGEVYEKGSRTQTGRKKYIDKCSNPGHKVAYGYDSQVVDRDGVVRCVVTYLPKKICEGHHYIEKSKKYLPNIATCRLVTYPDGKTERFDDYFVLNPKDGKYSHGINRPIHQRSYLKHEVINPEQADKVKECFRLADAPHCLTNSAIATKTGLDDCLVRTILKNPIYKGYPVDGKDLSRILKSEERKYKEPMEIPLSDARREAIRIVSVEQFDRVAAARAGTSKSNQQRASLDGFWCKTFSKCACNEILGCRTPQSNGAGNRYACMECGTFIERDILHSIVDKWLSDINSFASLGGIAYADTWLEETAILNEIENRIWQFMDLHTEISEPLLQEFMLNNMKDETCWYVRGKDNTLTGVLGVYDRVLNMVNKPQNDAIQACKDKIENIVQAILQFNNPAIKERLEQEANEVTAEMEKLIKQNEKNEAKEYRKIQDMYAKLETVSAKLISNIVECKDEHKAILLRDMIDKIVVKFNMTHRMPNVAGKGVSKTSRPRGKRVASVTIYSKNELVPVYTLNF
jgi:hypothetical protein